MKVSEPEVSCDTNIIQKPVHNQEIPCVFTDEELQEELRLSEESGFISHEEALKEFFNLIEGQDEEYTTRAELARGITEEELLEGLHTRIKTRI